MIMKIPCAILLTVFAFVFPISNSEMMDHGAERKKLSFMVNGDWGGKSHWPYTSPAQLSVAKALGKRAGEIGARFTLLLGDNFYKRGVKSVHDPRWRDTFENVFTSKNLQNDRHFRVIAGNHDHDGSVSAQIDYSSKSHRWFFPRLYYDFTESRSNMRIHFVMIDTTILQRKGHESKKHWAWLHKVLEHSSADFLVVAGHHPIWSSGSHGPSWKLRALKTLLEASRASIYLSGHDHCAEHLKDEGVHYHVIGAGNGFSSKCGRGSGGMPKGLSRWNYVSRKQKKGAFAEVVVDAIHGLVLTHLDSNGKVLYRAPAVAPRKARKLHGAAFQVAARDALLERHSNTSSTQPTGGETSLMELCSLG